MRAAYPFDVGDGITGRGELRRGRCRRRTSVEIGPRWRSAAVHRISGEPVGEGDRLGTMVADSRGSHSTSAMMVYVIGVLIAGGGAGAGKGDDNAIATLPYSLFIASKRSEGFGSAELSIAANRVGDDGCVSKRSEKGGRLGMCPGLGCLRPKWLVC